MLLVEYECTRVHSSARWMSVALKSSNQRKMKRPFLIFSSRAFKTRRKYENCAKLLTRFESFACKKLQRRRRKFAYNDATMKFSNTRVKTAKCVLFFLLASRVF